MGEVQLCAAIAVIPARFGSTRFAAKILASQTGQPLVQHVVDQVRKCKRVGQVIVATDDVRVMQALRPFGTVCVMTARTHASGSDRVAEVARTLPAESLIVNVQGDEPEIDPSTVDALVERLQTTGDPMVTAAAPFPADADVADPNLVKVVVALDGTAIYFSRSPIPYHREPAPAAGAGVFLHVGIYGYRREFLLEYAAWQPTPLESAEKLEQLRVLEHGRRLGVVMIPRHSSGIDTPEQYEKFVGRMNRRQSTASRRDPAARARQEQP